MRLLVDPDRCDGTGVCTQLAPELFVLVEDQARVRVDEPEPASWSAAEEAARACPKLAITLHEGS